LTEVKKNFHLEETIITALKNTNSLTRGKKPTLTRSSHNPPGSYMYFNEHLVLQVQQLVLQRLFYVILSTLRNI